MRRTLMAFVSSTFVDLQKSRRLIGDQLVASNVMPRGMEIFPAVGEGPWRLIRETIEVCDFYVLLLGGRYGSPASDEAGEGAQISWTHAEYLYARKLRKPIVALVFAEPDSLPRKSADDSDSPIWAFRDKVKSEVTAYLYRDDADLIAGLHISLQYLRETQPWDDTKNPNAFHAEKTLEDFLTTSFDRTYDVYQSSWSYEKSPHRPERWDAHCQVGRILRANWPEGLGVWGYGLDKPTSEYEAFSTNDPPQLTLDTWSRSESGDIKLRDETRKLTGSNFARDIDFRPALRRGETSSFQLSVKLPGYRLAFREDLMMVSKASAGGQRDYETQEVRIKYPTGRLVMSAFLPDMLDAEIIGLRVSKNQFCSDDDESERIAGLAAYSDVTSARNGVLGRLLTLDLVDPVLHRAYSVRWRPPYRDRDAVGSGSANLNIGAARP